MACLGFLAAAAVLVAPIAAGQHTPSQVPLFKTGVDLVVMDVSVLDRDRHPVRGLTADQFIVLEDGRPQTLTAFSEINLPDQVEDTRGAWTREIAADVVKNDDVAGSRVIVMLLDDATPMYARDVPQVKQVANRVIDQLGPRDLATVVFALDRTNGQEFTHDRTRLRAAVDRFNGAIVGWGESPDTFSASASTLYFQVVDRLRGVAEYLVDLPQRRKALVFLSTGVPIDIDDMTPRPMRGGTVDAAGILQQLLENVQQVLAAAHRANVAVYGMDPAGLQAPGPAERTIDPESGALSPGGLNANPAKLNRGFLAALSENTGGFAIADTNNPTAGITQMLCENSSYYLLAYAASNPRAQGRFRKIDVRVAQPGVMVRARNGYFEPTRAGTTRAVAAVPEVDKALAGVVAKSDLEMQVSAAPFAIAWTA